MLTAARFTRAKIRKQPKHPCKENVAYMYDGKLLGHKKNEIMPFVATWMDLTMIILSDISRTEKDKNMILLICGI